ncbi:MAG: hypothetical protein E4H19_12115 [Chromatiales bacterium]|nr:MAG: hypothetical protein E4H19_12115 [Chromatiales bacterium]
MTTTLPWPREKKMIRSDQEEEEKKRDLSDRPKKSHFKTASRDIEFSHVSQPLPDARFYMLPSLKGDASISRHRLCELLDRVKAGAALYLSVDTALLSPFEEFSGLAVVSRSKQSGPDTVTLPGGYNVKLQGTYKLRLKAGQAEVLGTDADNNPVFTCASYGKGKVYFLGARDRLLQHLVCEKVTR